MEAKKIMVKRLYFKKIILIFIVIILTISFSIALYFGNYYKSNIEKIDDTSVVITEYDDYYFFDDSGNKNALIFYQGAKIDELAYLELLNKIAENGIDCFLLKMPFNFALLNVNKANIIINEYDYNFYVGGHSFGGAISCIYAKNNSNKIKGVVLLAAFSNKDLSNSDLRILSVLASRDNILKSERYQSALPNMPKDFIEITIDGGNHSYFGTYGLQKGDNEASITNQEQIEIVCKLIADFINND